MSPSLFPVLLLLLSPSAPPAQPPPAKAVPQSSEAVLLQAAKARAEQGDLIGAAKLLTPAGRRQASPALLQQRLKYLLAEENLVFAPAREALKAGRPDAAEQLLAPLFREESTLKATRRMMAEVRAQRSDLFLAAGRPALALAWMQGASQLDPAYSAKAEAIMGALENILQEPVLLVVQDASMNQRLGGALEARLKKQSRYYGIRFSLVPEDGQRLAGIQILKPELRDQELRRAPQLALKPGVRSIGNEDFDRLRRELETAENELVGLMIQRRRCQPAAPAAPAAPAPLKKACLWIPINELPAPAFGWPEVMQSRGKSEPLKPLDPADFPPPGRNTERNSQPLEPNAAPTAERNERTPLVRRQAETLPEIIEPNRNNSPQADQVRRGESEGVRPGAAKVDNQRGAGTVTQGTTQPAEGPWNKRRLEPRKHPVVPPLPAPDCPPVSCEVYDWMIAERECEIRRLRLAIAQTPENLQVPDDQQWSYQVITSERSLDAHAWLQVGPRRDQVSAVHEAIDQMTDKPNPDFAVPPDPLVLPGEVEMTDKVAPLLVARILERLSQMAWEQSLAELKAVPRPDDAVAALELDLMISFARMRSQNLQRPPVVTAADLEKLPKHP